MRNRDCQSQMSTAFYKKYGWDASLMVTWCLLVRQACKLWNPITANMLLCSVCINGAALVSWIGSYVYRGMLLQQNTLSVLQKPCCVCGSLWILCWLGLLLQVSTALCEACSVCGSA